MGRAAAESSSSPRERASSDTSKTCSGSAAASGARLQLGHQLLLEHVLGRDAEHLGNRRIGLSQIPDQLSAFIPDPPVRFLVLFEHRPHHAGQYVPALFEEEVRQREEALGEFEPGSSLGSPCHLFVVIRVRTTA
jgi:hypothetical protein